MGRFPYGSVDIKKDDKICRELIEIFELNEHMDQSYTTLSGGEQQRVQLARVFAQIWSNDKYKDKIIIIDEPTSYLDIKHQHTLFNFIKSINNKGLTVVMVLHDINQAITNSNKIIMLKDGKLLNYVKSNTILKNNYLSELFEVRTKVIDSPNLSNPLVVFDN
tara:strand:+ start:665 stop:1153 length:489 start_codon:yes stop_codon:yes gene_type:complete